MLRKALFTLVLIAVAGLTSYAQSLTVVGADEYHIASGTKKGSHTIYIEGDKMMMSAKDLKGDQSMIFDRAKGTFTMIDHSKKSYMVITKDEMQKMKSQIEEAQKQLEAQMESMTDEQKAQMKELMAKQTSMMGTVETVYTATGESKEVNGWTCKGYKGTKSEKHTKDVWAADLSTLGLTEADVQIMHDFADFISAMSSMTGDKGFWVSSKAANGYEGVPIKIERYEGGKVKSTSTITSVKKGAIPAGTFDIPTGYKKQSMPMSGGGY